MAIRKELLDPGRDCCAHLNALIAKLRDVKKSGCLNIFVYSPGQNSMDKKTNAEIHILLELAKNNFDSFQRGLKNADDWQDCFSNPEFHERSIEIIGQRLHAITFNQSVLSMTTAIENINNDMHGIMETFYEFSCVEGPEDLR